MSKKLNLIATVVKNGRSRKVRDALSTGSLVLRVVGSEQTGFRLGGQKNEVIKLFGQNFSKQADAVDYGQGKFQQKAKKAVGVSL